jgi:NADPH:quinone reductase-like Zn-dependent oxidoreductase
MSLAETTNLTAPPRMRAIHQTAYGGPEVLALTELPRPQVPADGVLVKVAATGLHRGDWHLMTGTPYLIRLAGFGVVRPKREVPGMSVSGTVVEVGPGVTRFAVGDPVLGEVPSGGFAEYVCAAEKLWVPKPEGLSFEDAACLPVSATTALQGLRDAGKLQPGQSVLINGAAGGVGTFAVQLAVAMGGVVTGVCSSKNVELVRSLGAHHVIDYTRDDVLAGDARFDVVLDLVGNHTVGAFRKVMKANGRFVSAAGGADHPWIGPMGTLLAGMLSNTWASAPFVPLVATPREADLSDVAARAAAGTLRVVVDRRYTLDEVPEALRHLGEGHSRGKSLVAL